MLFYVSCKASDLGINAAGNVYEDRRQRDFRMCLTRWVLSELQHGQHLGCLTGNKCPCAVLIRLLNEWHLEVFSLYIASAYRS